MIEKSLKDMVPGDMIMSYDGCDPDEAGARPARIFLVISITKIFWHNVFLLNCTSGGFETWACNGDSYYVIPEHKET